MKLSCLQENLARGLGVVGRAVASRSTLPITQNVMLSSDQGMLRLSATNLEIAITTWIGAMIEEEGAITVPHRLVADLVNSLPSDRVDLDLRGPDPDDPNSGGGSVLHLSCGRSLTHINGASADDFPPIPQVDSGFATNIDPSVLRQGIGLVAFSAASDESRPVLTGVELKLEESNIVMAAADGFRLAVYTGQLSEPVADALKVIVPARTMNEIQRLASEQSAPIQVTLSPEKGQVMFKLEHVEVVSQLLQGNFPNYDQLIPERYETRAVMELDDLKRATQSAAVFARDGSNIVRLEMTPQESGEGGQLKVSARSEEVGDNLDELDIDQLDGEDAKIAFNVRYLMEIVNVLGRGKVALEVTNSSSPGVFRPADSDRYVHVVMPMYVQW
ncbi:MAG: DNA polymerase III subunit beta [Chloroflexi bacterium]|nr:DNA polymerase III subunit beta [Chloroflexota bacterium]